MSFKNILGQERPIQIIKSYLEQSRLGGGYLFTGPEGIGKNLVAKTIAKTLNCSQGMLDSCDECVSCKKIERNEHPDIHLLGNSDEEIKIEDIRQLQKDISFRAYEGKTKVFIIDNAHRLNAESANCLLKILEEPPKDSLIILVSDKPVLIFKTIISRCKIVKFYPMPRNALQDILCRDYGLKDSLAHFFAYFCEGRIGSALRLKETELINQRNTIIDKFVLSIDGNLDQLPAQKKEELKGSLNILATWFRDMYLIKIGLPHQELINYDRKNELLHSMSKYTFSDLNEILSTISDSILYLDQNINSRLVMQTIGAQLWKV